MPTEGVGKPTEGVGKGPEDNRKAKGRCERSPRKRILEGALRTL